MKRFVNEYEYTKDIAEEAHKAYIKQTAGGKYDRIVLPGIAILGVGMAVLARNPLYLLLVAAAMFIFFLQWFTISHSVKTEMARMKVLHNSADSITTKYVLEERLRLYKNGEEWNSVISLDDITGTAETEQLLVLFFKGKIMVPFKKDSFTEGTADEFREYINKLCK